MMPKHAVAATLAAVLISGCSHSLSRDEAKNVIERNSLVRQSDNVSVDAISNSGPSEAVVRASIAGAVTNLKFRRFDTGWAWEFVETKSGGWIAPDVAIGQIREEHRVVAAAKWAEQNSSGYATTAQTIEYVGIYHAHNPKAVANADLVNRLNRSLAEMFRKQPDKDSQERYAVITNDRWSDAWGSDIQLGFNAKDHSWVITSPGADKTKGTEDDLLCLSTFREDFEQGRMVWHRDKTWRVPEGLGGAIQSFIDRGTDKVEYSKVAKP
jgi:hypothetical protein